MSKVISRAILAASVLSLLFAGALGEQRAQVTRGEITRSVYGAGEVQPLSQPGVFAPLDAEVGSVLKGMGDAVSAGDIVMMLKDDALDAEIEQLQYDVLAAQEAVRQEETYAQYSYRPYTVDGEIRYDVDTGEMLIRRYSTELSIYSPCDGRVMAVYIEPGSDALATYRKYGSVVMLSTDGRMKVELDGVKSGLLSLNDTVNVRGEGFETGGSVVNLARAGTQAVIQVSSDEYDMDAAVRVYTQEGTLVGEGILQINKPMAVSAYGGTIKGVAVYVGRQVKQGDLIARFLWKEMPLYLDNASALLAYAKAQTAYEQALAKREKLAVIAPCDGVVASVEVATDSEVTAGTKLMSIVEDAGMSVILTVDELDIIGVKKGQQVTMSVDALSDVTLRGTVEKIAPIGNTQSSVTTYDVYVTLGETDGRVMGGMNVSGEIAIGTQENALLIPAQALMKDHDGYYVVLPGGEMRRVKTGVMTADTVQITEGLFEGETIVY